jgi:catechol 2,3-dioxygenase-like lactoylglutathione lyase family enzyme
MSVPTPLVTGVDFASIATQDLDAAREFYGSLLGLEADAPRT